MPKKLFRSAKETKKFAATIAKKFSGGIIALSGDLGSGKTTFTQGFAEGLGIKDKIISPTFVLERQHQIPNSNRILFHLDLYRLGEEVNINNLGLNDKLQDSKNIIIIEWGEKAKSSLPAKVRWIYFKRLSGNIRELTF